MARHFELPEEDREYLEVAGFEWETVVDGSTKWLLIHNRAVPKGYAQSACTIALQIPPSYPEAQLDMAYFYPPLQRADGQTIRALADQRIGSMTYQRWSRHRTNENPWRPGIDGIATHLAYAEEWLSQELQKK
jgi:hypothetical protein